MIKGIKVVTIPVRNRDRALDFYTKSLGFTIVTDRPFDDVQRWIELRIPGSEARVVLLAPEGYEDRIGTLQPVTFYSNDVQKTYETLLSRGVEFTAPRQIPDWAVRRCSAIPMATSSCCPRSERREEPTSSSTSRFDSWALWPAVTPAMRSLPWN